MKNSKVAEGFAKGIWKGEGSNLFIKDNIIYSYGTHFPIAIRLIDGNGYKYIWNIDKYSVTTSKHQSLVKRAIGEENIIKGVITPDMSKYFQYRDVKTLMVDSLGGNQ